MATNVKSIFAYENYKEFLKSWLEDQPNHGWGRRTSLARAIRCQPAYLSQVIHKSAHLSPEQALSAAKFLELAPGESRYFRLLVAFGRAGTEDLKTQLSQELMELRVGAGVKSLSSL